MIFRYWRPTAAAKTISEISQPLKIIVKTFKIPWILESSENLEMEPEKSEM